MSMLDFFSLIWEIAITAITDEFMNSNLSLLVYFCLIAAVVCYFINLVKYLRKF